MITIYGSPMSSAGRCFWCLEEANVEYETKAISFKDKEHKSEEFLKINPNGKVPALVDGDFTIWESMAINFYLADTYCPSLLGSDTKQRGLVHQWSIWSIADLQVPIIDAFIQLNFVPEDRRNQELIDKSLGKLPAMLTTLNNSLSTNKFLVGSEFTLADLNVASVVGVCDHIQYDLSEYKNISQWRSAISDRPGFQKYLKLLQ